jgi:hypothetical protein
MGSIDQVLATGLSLIRLRPNDQLGIRKLSITNAVLVATFSLGRFWRNDWLASGDLLRIDQIIAT